VLERLSVTFNSHSGEFKVFLVCETRAIDHLVQVAINRLCPVSPIPGTRQGCNTLVRDHIVRILDKVIACAKDLVQTRYLVGLGFIGTWTFVGPTAISAFGKDLVAPFESDLHDATPLVPRTIAWSIIAIPVTVSHFRRPITAILDQVRVKKGFKPCVDQESGDSLRRIDIEFGERGVQWLYPISDGFRRRPHDGCEARGGQVRVEPSTLVPHTPQQQLVSGDQPRRLASSAKQCSLNRPSGVVGSSRFDCWQLLVKRPVRRYRVVLCRRIDSQEVLERFDLVVG